MAKQTLAEELREEIGIIDLALDDMCSDSPEERAECTALAALQVTLYHALALTDVAAAIRESALLLTTPVMIKTPRDLSGVS